MLMQAGQLYRNPMHFLTKAVNHRIDTEVLQTRSSPTESLRWAVASVPIEGTVLRTSAPSAGSQNSKIANRVSIRVRHVGRQKSYKLVKRTPSRGQHAPLRILGDILNLPVSDFWNSPFGDWGAAHVPSCIFQEVRLRHDPVEMGYPTIARSTLVCIRKKALEFPDTHLGVEHTGGKRERRWLATAYRHIRMMAFLFSGKSGIQHPEASWNPPADTKI